MVVQVHMMLSFVGHIGYQYVSGSSSHPTGTSHKIIIENPVFTSTLAKLPTQILYALASGTCQHYLVHHHHADKGRRYGLTSNTIN